MSSILARSAVALARSIRERELSSAEVVEAHIAQIERVNPTLNAIVRDRFDHARLEAKDADARVSAGAALPPLCGVPCTIKESIAVEGMPNSAGLVARAQVVATEDATVVARLRQAGAIPLGVSNTSEITAWPGADNRVYGRTVNAYDPARTCGGSSGGEGAIVGAGGSPFGIGTDVGGSIRIPAFCNGLFGHKPTGGLVPGTGQYPVYQGRILRINTTGPLARRAEDLMPLLRIIAGPDGEDAGCEPFALGNPASVDVGSLRVTVVEGDGVWPNVHHALRAVQQNAAYALARRGARVEMRGIPRLRRSMEIYAGLALEEPPGMEFARSLGDGEPIPISREIGRAVLGRSDHTLPVLLAAAAMSLAARGPERIRRGADEGRALRAELDELLGDDGVLLYPSARNVPPRSGRPWQDAPRFSCAAIFNVMELPVTQVPLGLGAKGLPLGVQVVAPHGRDHLAIAVALELERTFGGWVPPSPLEDAV